MRVIWLSEQQLMTNQKFQTPRIAFQGAVLRARWYEVVNIYLGQGIRFVAETLRDIQQLAESQITTWIECLNHLAVDGKRVKVQKKDADCFSRLRHFGDGHRHHRPRSGSCALSWMNSQPIYRHGQRRPLHPQCSAVATISTRNVSGQRRNENMQRDQPVHQGVHQEAHNLLQ